LRREKPSKSLLRRRNIEEAFMTRFLLVAAAVLAFTALQPDTASAQRGMHFGGGFGGFHGGMGGFRGAAIGGGFGGFRGGMVGGGFRGGVIGGGFRTAAIGGWRPGWGGRWGGGWGWGRGWGWRRGWGWPIAAGIGIGALGYYGSPYYGYGYDQCLAWIGFRWVNTCYQPYGYDW
jgi:hypothetical protein